MKLSNVSSILLLGALVLNGCGGGSSSPTGKTVADTTAPVFTSSATTSVQENQTTVITVTATDASAITYSISGGDDGSKFTLNSSTGALSFTTAPDYEAPADTDTNNIYNLTVTATDASTNSTTQNISVTITNDSSDDPAVPKSIKITEDIQVESLGSSKSIDATISLGSTPKSLYLVLSNTDTISSSNPTITHNAKIVPQVQAKVFPAASTMKRPIITHRPQYVEDFLVTLPSLLAQGKADILKRNAKTLSVPEKNKKDIVGQSHTFYISTNQSESTVATARKVISNVSTPFGNKTLNIWVSNDSFGTSCPKTKCVTQEMVDALANSFLQSGSDNDVYDWVTNVYGEEWGSEAQNVYSNLIGVDNTITILLTDIDGDNSPDGGTIGYFFAKDNFEQSSFSGSNERIMFYADAVIFANDGEDGVWSFDDDFWPKEMVSTLAHEFQHMIHFYQKTILLEDGNPTDTWINEMVSETTEDLVATKIQHTGSRGVDYTDGSAGEADNTLGRYPLFNENNTLSLTKWDNSLANYSMVNAFGSYLTRNYGGAKVLHDIVYSTSTDKQAIIDAVHKSPEGAGKTFADLLSEWGMAVMLSDHISPYGLPTYNTGDFTPSTYNGITYDLGSVNFFNYYPQPNIYSRAGRVRPEGNYYYKIGDNLTGDISLNLDNLNGQTEVTLIAK